LADNGDHLTVFDVNVDIFEAQWLVFSPGKVALCDAYCGSASTIVERNCSYVIWIKFLVAEEFGEAIDRDFGLRKRLKKHFLIFRKNLIFSNKKSK
jgi:hypothetical protein